jgi:hypothetical protein
MNSRFLSALFPSAAQAHAAAEALERRGAVLLAMEAEPGFTPQPLRRSRTCHIDSTHCGEAPFDQKTVRCERSSLYFECRSQSHGNTPVRQNQSAFVRYAGKKGVRSRPLARCASLRSIDYSGARTNLVLSLGERL